MNMCSDGNTSVGSIQEKKKREQKQWLPKIKNTRIHWKKHCIKKKQKNLTPVHGIITMHHFIKGYDTRKTGESVDRKDQIEIKPINHFRIVQCVFY